MSEDESNTQQEGDGWAWRTYRAAPCGHECSGVIDGNEDTGSTGGNRCTDDESVFIQLWGPGHGEGCSHCDPNVAEWEDCHCIDVKKDVQGNCVHNIRPCGPNNLSSGGICPWLNTYKIDNDPDFAAKWQNYIPPGEEAFIPPKHNALTDSRDNQPPVAEANVFGALYDNCAKCQVQTAGPNAEEESFEVTLAAGEEFEVMIHLTEDEVSYMTFNEHKFVWKIFEGKLTLFYPTEDGDGTYEIQEAQFSTIGESHTVDHTEDYGWDETFSIKWVGEGSYHMTVEAIPVGPTTTPTPVDPTTTPTPVEVVVRTYHRYNDCWCTDYAYHVPVWGDDLEVFGDDHKYIVTVPESPMASGCAKYVDTLDLHVPADHVGITFESINALKVINSAHGFQAADCCVPVPTPDPCPHIDGDPHVTTFFGEKYDM